MVPPFFRLFPQGHNSNNPVSSQGLNRESLSVLSSLRRGYRIFPGSPPGSSVTRSKPQILPAWGCADSTAWELPCLKFGVWALGTHTCHIWGKGGDREHPGTKNKAEHVDACARLAARTRAIHRGSDQRRLLARFPPQRGVLAFPNSPRGTASWGSCVRATPWPPLRRAAPGVLASLVFQLPANTLRLQAAPALAPSPSCWPKSVLSAPAPCSGHPPPDLGHV